MDLGAALAATVIPHPVKGISLGDFIWEERKENAAAREVGGLVNVWGDQL